MIADRRRHHRRRGDDDGDGDDDGERRHRNRGRAAAPGASSPTIVGRCDGSALDHLCPYSTERERDYIIYNGILIIVRNDSLGSRAEIEDWNDIMTSFIYLSCLTTQQDPLLQVGLKIGGSWILLGLILRTCESGNFDWKLHPAPPRAHQLRSSRQIIFM